MLSQDTGAQVPNEDYWVSAADLLGGALILFLLLMIYFMLTQQEEGSIEEQAWQETVASLREELKGAQINVDSVKEVAVLYDQKRDELYHQLVQEFGQDLERWNAEIESDLTVRFNEPDVLFGVGSWKLQPEFQDILIDFFPRYMEVITSADFGDSIAELRIEGHTSSFWNRQFPAPPQEAYLKNMDLSYQRARSVLRFVMQLPDIEARHLPWLRKHLTANGLSSSRLVLDPDGSENTARSQRVEVRVRTDAESKMAKILELSNE